MDPLSITLAVITLATALKDIIETAEVIRDSFSKTPQNYRNAKRLAEEVLKTLRGMNEIYQKHEQTFRKAPFLQKTMNDLQIKMQSVHEQCACLILPVSERRRIRFKVALISFWNRGKVEQLLSELKDNVDRCSQQFHHLSSFQTDALIMEIHNTIVQSTPHGSAVVHGPKRLGTSTMSHSGLGNVTNTQLFAFTQSTPMPMTWIPDTIPLRDLSEVYLRREIGRVNLSLQSLSARWSQNPPTNIEIPTFSTTWDLKEKLVPSLIVHQHAVVLAIQIQSGLRQIKSNSWNFSVRLIDNMLTRLWPKLAGLGMYEDSLAICTLRVNLWREITRQYPSANSSRYLVHALRCVGSCLLDYHTEAQDQARLKIKEAIDILGSLVESKVDIAQNWSLQIISNRLHCNESPQLVLDSMLRVEAALGLNFLQSGVDVPSPSTWTSISSSVAVALQNQKISDDDWYTYAFNLLRIEESQNQPLKSHDLGKVALTISNHLLIKYPDSDRVLVLLKYVLNRLSFMSFDETDSVACTENLEFTNQYLTVLRRLVLIDPQRHVLNLSDTLWKQRTILIALDRSIEAENAYRDMIDLKSLAVAPPHSNLQIPSDTEGDYYARLAECHYDADRLSDAIYAAQNAISQYSALEFMTPDRSRDKHFSTLDSLCGYLSAANQYDAVLTEGKKAIKMIENTNTHGSDSVYHHYASILDKMMDALAWTHPGTRALAQAEDIGTRIRMLAHSRKKGIKSDLVHGLRTYANVLQNNALVKEASEYLQDLLDNWEKVYGMDIRKDLSSFNVADAGHLALALNSHALVQLYSCLPNDAIATATEALSLWRTIEPTDAPGVHYYRYPSLLALTQGLHDIGKVDEALNRLDEAEKAAQKQKSVDSMEELVASAECGFEYETLLFERSKLLFTKGDYREAVKLIKEVEDVLCEDSIEDDLSILETIANILSYSHVLYCTLGRHDEGHAAAAKLAKLKESIRETSPGSARVMDVRQE